MIRSVRILSILFFFILSFNQQAFSSPDSVLSEDVFVNAHASGDIGAVDFEWALAYDEVNRVENVIIRYKRKVDKDKSWKYTAPIDAKETSYTVEGLKEDDKYYWEIGCMLDGSDISKHLSEGIPPEDLMVYTDKSSVTTERAWGFYMFLVLIGSLGLFVFGMKLMSEGLQQSAGGKLRQILSTMTANKYLGVLSGFLITGLVQSSSATTVMTVSFVNAGLLTLVESAGVMMGANIGTTITGWLVSIFGFKVSISSYSLIFIAVAAPLMFAKSKNLKAWGNAIIGFAILFMGLGFLKDAVPSLGHDSGIIEFFKSFSDIPFLGRLVFVFLGTLVTIVVQSSSAAMALTLTLVFKGDIPFDVGAAMILGENIGTTITAEIASLVGNVHAKRSARIHSMFNIVGVTWMVILLPVVLSGLKWAMVNYMGMDPFTDGEAATVGLAAFHTIFNLTNVLILIWFVPWLVKIAIKTVKSKGEEDEIFKLEYISAGITKTPELSVLEAKKEVVKFGELTLRMQKKLVDLLNETEPKKVAKLLKKISRYEEITDNIEREVADYLGKVSANDLSEKSSNDLRAMLTIINELERIGDIIFQISKIIEKKNEKRIWFDQKQRDQLNGLCDLLEEAFNTMIENISKDYPSIDMDPAQSIEASINAERNKIRKRHIKRLENKEYSPSSGLVYSNLFTYLERIGDHLINVSESASGINLE